jgi:nucleoside-diphosphate-sugar epimerase
VPTGGTWVHGSGDLITEDSPIDPPPIVAWCPAVLQRLRAAAGDGIRTVVVAPANLYGASAGIPALLRSAPTTDEPEPAVLHVGNANQRFVNVHRDDIATLYAFPYGKQMPGPTTWAPTRRARR